MCNENKNWKNIITKIFICIIFWLLIFLIIDYLVVNTLIQSAEATELPNAIADAENGADVDNTEVGLDNNIFEEELRTIEELSYSSGTIFTIFIVYYIFGIPSFGFIWW